MTKPAWNKLIIYLTAILLFCLSVLSMVLSYHALQNVAANNGVSGNLSFIWPLLIDGALVVFSLAVLRAALTGYSERWPWLMVGTFTVLTIFFNLVNAETDLLHWFVAAIPPVALVLSFETLMGMLRVSMAEVTQPTNVILVDDTLAAPGRSDTEVTMQANGTVTSDNHVPVTKLSRRERLAQLPELTQAGLSVDEMAAKLGVSTETVYRDLRGNGR